MLEEIIIPRTITVHLGRPNTAAENLTVDFVYYLKNVASSEIYPTWPYEALRANIWAQMSLVLNRVYTEWYRGRGYPFDITNSTAYDPEYCDGKIAQCPGMKQWGTLDLANRGFDSTRIIRYYYGDTMQFRETDNVQYITPSYPGYALRRGSQGQNVFIIQELLNGIAVNYPNIPLIYPPDGIFGEVTERAVRTFQQQFNLSVDGIVGQTTWNQISRIYVAVRKLAELGSLGRPQGYFTGLWTGRVLRRGDVGIEVQQLQYFLSVIAQTYTNIPPVDIDSRFGAGLERSVRAFQREFGLAQDGLVGQVTWNTIYETYIALTQ